MKMVSIDMIRGKAINYILKSVSISVLERKSSFPRVMEKGDTLSQLFIWAFVNFLTYFNIN